MGSFLIMGLIGIIIASAGQHLPRQLGAPVRDQRDRRAGVHRPHRLGHAAASRRATTRLRRPGEMVAKGAIMGALSLYLDFINLFMMLLQLFGDRR